MGRSVDYLNNAIKVNFFPWPKLQVENEEGEFIDSDEEFEDSYFVIEDIQETIKSNFPEFENCNRWDGREVHIILQGYGTEIGLSDYCGLSSLSIRVINDSDGDEYDRVSEWIDKNWSEIGKYWNVYRRVGRFSNGEGVYEKVQEA
jgi:hypothetical protein